MLAICNQYMWSCKELLLELSLEQCWSIHMGDEFIVTRSPWWWWEVPDVVDASDMVIGHVHAK